MNRTINIGLSQDGIRKAIRELNTYRNVTLPMRLNEFVSKLADVGITVGQLRVSGDLNARGLIAFSKQYYNTIDGVEGFVIATELGTITSTWVNMSGTHTAEVSPLLMTEYGSGQFADGYRLTLPNGIEVGRGTFPGQTHAYQNSWSWKDEYGEIHHSRGWKPTAPVINAWREMVLEINNIATQVFSR